MRLDSHARRPAHRGHRPGRATAAQPRQVASPWRVGPRWSAIDGRPPRAWTSVPVRGRLWSLDYVRCNGAARLGGVLAVAGRCGGRMCGVCGAVDDARCDVTLCVLAVSDVCVSVRVCTRSAPAVRASQVCRLNIFLIPTLIPHSRPRSTDRRTSRSTTGRTSVSAHGYDMIMHTMRRGSFLWLRTPPQLSLHAHRALSGVRQLSQHPPRSAAALQTCISLCASATAQAHNDEATRRRAPRRAALSTARHAQLMRSIGSEQHLRVLHSLVTRAPPRALCSIWRHSHDG